MGHEQDFWRRPAAFRGRHKGSHSVLVQATFSKGQWHGAEGYGRVYNERTSVKILRLVGPKCEEQGFAFVALPP